MLNINQSLVFNKEKWSFNTIDYIKDTVFYGNGARVEMSDKLGSFYMISGSKYINSLPNSTFDISGFHELFIECEISIIDVGLNLYVLDFSDKEKIGAKSYRLQDGVNVIKHNFLKESVYVKFALRVESQKEYSRFNIDRLKVSSYLDKSDLDSKGKTVFSKKVSLPYIKHTKDSMNFIPSESTYSIVEDGIEFNFYLNYKKGKKLLISLPGAIDRKKRVYNFQRYSWSKDVDYSFMSLLDPTIHEENELEIGWFQGRHDEYPLPKFINLLKKIFDKNGIKEEDVLFFGSSAGGFVALQLSNFFPYSKVVAINPQIYIDRYYKSKFDQLVEYSYSGMSSLEIRGRFDKRISVDIDFSKRIESIYYYQNSEDRHHLTHHLKRYLETLDEEMIEQVTMGDELDSNKKMHIIVYSDVDKKHTPPNKEETLKIINNAFMHQVKG